MLQIKSTSRTELHNLATPFWSLIRLIYCFVQSEAPTCVSGVQSRPGFSHEEYMHLGLLLWLLNCCSFCFLKYALDKWPHFHSFSLTSICHKRQHLAFWKLGHILDEYETLWHTCPSLSPCLLLSLHTPAKIERGCIVPVFQRG